MKKLLIILMIAFVGCIGSQVKDTIKLDLPELEGVEMKPLNDWLGDVTIEQLQASEGFDKTIETPTRENSTGMSLRHEYVWVVYAHPTRKEISYGIFSVIVDGKQRLERVAIFLTNPYGWMMQGCFDRYKNTELWYSFDRDEWDAQYPAETIKDAPDFDRFKRDNAI